MKRKLILTLTALALIAGAFLIGRNMPNKYKYLNLDTITETEIYGDTIVIYTDTDSYIINK